MIALRAAVAAARWVDQATLDLCAAYLLIRGRRW